MTEYLLTMTKGEVFNIVVGLMVLLTVVIVVITPEARKFVVRFLKGSKIGDTQDKIWFWVGLALMLLIMLGSGPFIARVIVEIISWIGTVLT